MSEKSKHKIDVSVVICAILCVVLLALCVVGVIFGVRDGVPVVAYADDELYGEIVYHPNLLPEYNYGFGINFTLDSSYPKQANLVHGDTVYFSLQRAQYGYATIDGVITEGHTQFLVHKSSGTTSASQRPQLYIIFPVTVELNTLYTYYCDVYNGSGTVVFGFCDYDFDTNTVTASTGTSVAIVSSAPVVTRTSSSTQYSYFYIALTSSSTTGSESYLTTNYMKLEEGVFYSGREPLSSGEMYNQGYNAGSVSQEYIDSLVASSGVKFNLQAQYGYATDSKQILDYNPDGSQFVMLTVQSSRIGDYTRANSNVASPYSYLDLDLPYAIFYNTRSIAGWYFVRHSISTSGSANNRLVANVPFSLTLNSGKLVAYNSSTDSYVPSGRCWSYFLWLYCCFLR